MTTYKGHCKRRRPSLPKGAAGYSVGDYKQGVNLMGNAMGNVSPDIPLTP
jgi:hypothetical protein